MDASVAAIDLGASSGRVMLARVSPDRLDLQAVARFPNTPVSMPDGLHWNVVELYERALDGLAIAARKAGGRLASIAVDSWAVDYGLLREGRLLGVPFHYRDEGRSHGSDQVHASVSPTELYERNGLQYLPFNTLYQLAGDDLVGLAEDLLLVPDLLGYWLTGNRVTERTNASTTGLLNVHTGDWDSELIERLGLPAQVFGNLVDPGTRIGAVLPAVQDRIGAWAEVTTVGSHDTASAVVGVPLSGDDAAFVSCGTWGLVGVELEKPIVTEASRLANFTNEGGVDGRTRFLTNVMGLWLLSETMRSWEKNGYVEKLEPLLRSAAALPATRLRTFDVQDPMFLAPGDMAARISDWYVDNGFPPPASRPAMVRAIVESLAQGFADAVDAAERLSGRVVRTINLVGGGALNQLLCQTIADRSGRVVIAGPVEATAIGNVVVQARTVGVLSGELEDLRALVASSSDLIHYAPRPLSERT